MRIVTNQKLTTRNRQLTNYTFIITLVVLVGGFFLVNQSLFTGEAPENSLVLILQSLILPAAFVMTLFSVRMTNLWGRRPYPEEAIQEGLKGLSTKSVIYNYHHLPARHVLICPQGIFPIVTRWHDGQFSVEGRKWTTHKSALSRILSAIRMDGIGDPSYDCQRAEEQVRKLLTDIDSDVEVQPLIVFINPKVELLEIKDPEYPVLYADSKKKPNLTDYLRELKRQSDNDTRNIMPLTDEQIEAFEEATL